MKKKFWWQLTSKEKKEIFDRSTRIFYGFDGIEDDGTETGKYRNIIKETILQVAEKEHDKLLGMTEMDEAEDCLWNFFESVCHPAFAIGYIFGQMFDLPRPDLLKDVEALKNKAKERRCFAYLPREKKAA